MLSSKNAAIVNTNIQLKRILVMNTSVIDRLAIKFIMCTQLQLYAHVDFVSSSKEVLKAMRKLKEQGGDIGYAIVIIDLQAQSSYIKKIVEEIRDFGEKNELGYEPKLVLLSDEMDKQARKRQLKSMNVQRVTGKPLSQESTLRLLKQCNYDY